MSMLKKQATVEIFWAFQVSSLQSWELKPMHLIVTKVEKHFMNTTFIV